MSDQPPAPAKLPILSVNWVAASGTIAIGMNAAGSFLAIGGNTAAPISIGAINAVGLVSVSLVNAIGPYAIGGVNGIGLDNPIAGLVAASLYAVIVNVHLAWALLRSPRVEPPPLSEPPSHPLSALPSPFEGWTRADDASLVGSSLVLREGKSERTVELSPSILDVEVPAGPVLAHLRTVTRLSESAEYRSAAANLVYEAVEIRARVVPADPFINRFGGAHRQRTARAVGSLVFLLLLFAAYAAGWLG